MSKRMATVIAACAVLAACEAERPVNYCSGEQWDAMERMFLACVTAAGPQRDGHYEDDDLADVVYACRESARVVACRTRGWRTWSGWGIRWLSHPRPDPNQ